MVRKSMWAALAVLLAYAPGALAYEYVVRQTAALTYAKELFGAGSASSRINYCSTVEPGCPSGVPKITLWTILSDGAAGAGDENAVDIGDEMKVTLTLSGAQLAFGFRSSHVAVQSYGTNDLTTLDPVGSRINFRELSVSLEDGGRSGDSSATWTVRAVGGGPGGGWTDDDGGSSGTVLEIAFELPELQGLNGRTPVTAQITVDAGGGSGFRSSDDALATVGVTDTGTAKSPSGGILRAAGPANAQGVRPSLSLITFADALTFADATRRLETTPATVGSASIDLAGGRTGFTPVGGVFPYAFLARPRVGVASATISELSGETFSIARHKAGQGDLVIGVTGHFHESGDIVFLDLNCNWQPDSDERLTLRDGVMSGRFGLIDVAGSQDCRVAASSASEEEKRASEEGVASRWLLFRPNFVDTLRPSDYRTTTSVDFTAPSNVDKEDRNSIAVDLRTAYTVVNDDATRRAHAIPPVGSAETGNVRIKCETAVDCPLYLECDDAAGEDWFQKLADDVPARSTLRLTSEMIAEHLGVSEAGWEGRLACSVMSTQDISVQVLNRSGNVLVNNTYIDN